MPLPQLTPTAFRFSDADVEALYTEIQARPAGIRKTRMFDLREELRDLRIDHVYNVQTSGWRYRVSFPGEMNLNAKGERLYAPSLRLEEKTDTIRFATFEEAVVALGKYLESL